VTVRLSLDVPDDLMAWLRGQAEESFRTPDGQALWLLRQAWSHAIPARPGPDPEALQVLAAELRKARAQAGAPSVRVIAARARQAGGQMSHTTVNDSLRGLTLPSWPTLERIVTALDGDAERFRALWVQARTAKG
jgi:hypothetical protein